MSDDDKSYTRTEVVAGGFEARCVDRDGTCYLWHGQHGIRVGPGRNATIWITKTSGLPEGPWLPTELGRQEIAESAEARAD